MATARVGLMGREIGGCRCSDCIRIVTVLCAQQLSTIAPDVRRAAALEALEMSSSQGSQRKDTK